MNYYSNPILPFWREYAAQWPVRLCTRAPHPPVSMQRRHERKGYSWFGTLNCACRRDFTATHCSSKKSPKVIVKLTILSQKLPG